MSDTKGAMIKIFFGVVYHSILINMYNLASGHFVTGLLIDLFNPVVLGTITFNGATTVFCFKKNCNLPARHNSWATH